MLGKCCIGILIPERPRPDDEDDDDDESDDQDDEDEDDENQSEEISMFPAPSGPQRAK